MQLLIMTVNTVGGYLSKGDIVDVRATSHVLEVSPSLCTIECPDPVGDKWFYRSAWEVIVDYVIVNNNPSLDGYRLRMFSALVDSSGNGSVSKNQVEAFINNWGGTIHSFGQNEVVFDITIYDAITSKNFWGRDVTEYDFTETDYNESTGVHTIEVDYSSQGVNPTTIEKVVSNSGANVISHENKVITFEIDRATVRTRFEEDIKEKSKEIVKKSRYHVGTGVVDYIVGQGGFVQTDLTTLLGYISDKVDD